MKVGELRELINGVNGDAEVLIEDVNGMCIHLVGGGEMVINEGIVLTTQQEFPDAWFDENNHEIDWNYHEIDRKDVTETDDILIQNEALTGKEEVSVRMTFHDGYAEGNGVKLYYPKLSELTSEQIEEIDRYTGGRIVDSGVITPYDVAIKLGEVAHFGVMDGTNGHNKQLVKDINVRWAEDKPMFKPILQALYERDAEEILNSESFTFDEAADAEWVEDYMKTKWDEVAGDYLTNIADDQDLEVILMYVRYDRSEH